MPQHIQKLSSTAVKKKREPGMYGDGGGLWLQVSPTGSKSWVFRYMLHGRAREMGLGSLEDIGLADARTKATESRRLLREGLDPIEQRDAKRLALRLEQAKSLSFEACAQAYIEAHEGSWRNPKHASQWRNTLRDYAYPLLAKLPIAHIDTGLVLKVLEPIWKSKPETASRVRGRMESILDWATVRQFRRGENPARWKGHLDHLLPSRSKIAKVRHHAALPYQQVGQFMTDLRQRSGMAARALEFTILTATRTSEALNAKWEEFDLQSKLWVVPAERMKSQREHRIPLSPPAIELLQSLRDAKESTYVFPGARSRKPLSNMAMLKVLDRLGQSSLTVHGFRSTFRDWAAEATAYPREVAEMALAHIVSDKVEAAYRRGDLFLKRQQMMNDWGKFTRTVRVTAEANVISIRAKKRRRT